MIPTGKLRLRESWEEPADQRVPSAVRAGEKGGGGDKSVTHLGEPNEEGRSLARRQSRKRKMTPIDWVATGPWLTYVYYLFAL